MTTTNRCLRLSNQISKGKGEDGELTLSSLSTAEDIVRILSVGTPHTWKIPSRIFLWLIFRVRIQVSGTKKKPGSKEPPHLDGEFADVERGECLTDDHEDFRVGEHGVEDACYVEILHVCISHCR